jgi:F420 biosynthesis protein FbiB-like protein
LHLQEKVPMSTSTGFRSNIMASPGPIERDNAESFTGSNPSTLTYTTIDLHNFLRTRRSIRRFKADPVPDSVIQSILSTATYAPSAHNRQPWRFCVLTGAPAKAALARAMAEDFERDLVRDGVAAEKIQAQIKRSKDRINAAPVAIILCLDMREMDTYPDPKRQQAERTMAVQSVAAAGLQLLLAAHAEGLGGVWVCSPLFAQETIQKTLDIPASWEPQGMFFIGYTDETLDARERKDIEAITLFF